MPTTHIGLTIPIELFEEIERLRGREKRATFISMLVKVGLQEYRKLHGQKIDVAKEA
jgi:metal-responsive CopG/Arc/MetJ family transcriptional regulator